MLPWLPWLLFSFFSVQQLHSRIYIFLPSTIFALDGSTLKELHPQQRYHQRHYRRQQLSSGAHTLSSLYIGTFLSHISFSRDKQSVTAQEFLCRKGIGTSYDKWQQQSDNIVESVKTSQIHMKIFYFF
ncbi:hypothetical protein QBC32DRAFT_66431 [Pseudoneurospora amorphoporcata]|uniref:Secreted protein n=1 Tax=Pseudoneurospora amorphoporcata TaxID=241081 RepID=A0AAN6NLJ9_9PEZI|nr:hypothetical protein QBC32DRAFT_66431 [Pseudoneurospora amorphoporcata]